MKIIQGISTSTGIAIGYAFILTRKEQYTIPKVVITEDERIPGWNRFEKALESTINYYNSLIDSKNGEQQAVVQTYLLMLTDSDFINQIKKEYESSSFNVEHIVQKKVSESASQLRVVGDAYLSERAKDIEDVFEKVLFQMLGYTKTSIDNIPQDAIIIADEIMPSEALNLFQKNIKGLILQDGGVTSHVAILARTYGIPAVFGIESPCVVIENNQSVIVDATKSLVIVEPDKAIRSDYLHKQENSEKRLEELASFITKKAETKDGTPITIYANIGTVQDAILARSSGADGIGLFRTEFLFMQAAEKDREVDEEEQFQAYSTVLQMMEDKPVTIRTLDVGADKIVDSRQMKFNQENNPLLGCRAIRYCLKNKNVFKTQLRALLRASIYGNLRIMLPLITTLKQIEETRKIINDVKQELVSEGISFKDNIPLGVMIETPAAALISDYMADKCDFFSIGTNDLTQYITVVDRENNDVAELYDELHPAVLRMIKHSVISAGLADIPVSVCGEMAGKEETLIYLLGMGVRIISVAPKLISNCKQILSKYTVKELKELTEGNSFFSVNKVR